MSPARRSPLPIQTLSRKNILIRDGYILPVLRHEVLEQRIGTRARDSARSRWTEHMGEHRCCMSRLQRRKGRSDTGGSGYETAPPPAPRDDSHLLSFHAPDRSRRGKVEEVSVLLKFSRHSLWVKTPLPAPKDCTCSSSGRAADL